MINQFKQYFSLLLVSLFQVVICKAESISKEAFAIDSIQQVIRSAKHDSVVVNAYVSWDDLIYLTDSKLDFSLNQKIEAICTKNLKKKLTKKESLFYFRKLAFALNNMGLVYFTNGNHKKAKQYFSRVLAINKSIHDKVSEARTLNNVGLVYKIQGNFATAIKYFTEGLTLYEKINDQLGVGVSLNNITGIYLEQGNTQKAIIYQQRALKIFKKIDHKEEIGNSFNNLGIIYKEMGQFTKANLYYHKAYEVALSIEYRALLTASSNNIGLISKTRADSAKLKNNHELSLKFYHEALDYLNLSLNTATKADDKKSMTEALNNLGVVYFALNDNQKAIDFADKALKIAKEIRGALEIRNAAMSLYKIFKKTGRTDEALAMHELYIQTRDSIERTENEKEVLNQEYKYKYQKQAAADSLMHIQEAEIKNAELKAQKKQQYFLYGGLFLVIAFSMFLFNRFRVTKKQKIIIEEQKCLVEEKQKEVMDSINYSRGLQQAILATSEEINRYLPNNFLFYRPKDIVAGDFYFFERVEDYVFYAAADCTGHGVPGAMVSIVCSSALSRCVKEFKLVQPGEILNKARELVLETFMKSGQAVNDGMDISFVTFQNCDGKIKDIRWAGANNPLWYIENGQIREIKANKQSIGKTDYPFPFTTHSVPLTATSLFLFTDGFADQFGGPKGKKFKYSNLQKLLLEIHQLEFATQIEKLETCFNTWRGELEQVDDVCVMGVRI